MTYTFAYRRYTLPFRTPMRTAHGAWTQREGLLVRLETENGNENENGNGNGKVLFGDCAPLPWFGTETVAESAAVCAALGARVTDKQLDAIPAKYPCLRFAVARASSPWVWSSTGFQPVSLGNLDTRPNSRAAKSRAGSPCYSNTQTHGLEARATPDLPVAALLPAGRAALAKIPALLKSGFRVFKWKVGVIDEADELALLDDVVAALPLGTCLRLDANGAWTTRRAAERWLAHCLNYIVEFVEQPIAPDAKNSDDLLLGLGNDYQNLLALDESVATAAGIRRWLNLGWPGVFVIKPALLGGAVDAAQILSELPPELTVFSSALETAIGARAALRLAFQFYATAKTVPTPPALGFGVHPLFRDARFDAPPAAPFIRLADLDTIKPEIPWNALS